MLKAVLFDLDHTLYDREATLINMAPAMKQDLAIPEDIDTVARALTIGEEQFYLPDYSFGGSRAIYPMLCGTLTLPDFDTYNNFISNRLAEFAVPYAYVRPLLGSLRDKGLRIGMVTNGKRSMQLHKLKTLGLLDIIEQLTCPDDAGVLKPEPGIFLHCLEALNVSPEAAIYVGDNPLDDIQGAVKAGIRSAWIRGNRSYPAWLPAPDYILGSAAEIEGIIANLL